MSFYNQIRYVSFYNQIRRYLISVTICSLKSLLIFVCDFSVVIVSFDDLSLKIVLIPYLLHFPSLTQVSPLSTFLLHLSFLSTDLSGISHQRDIQLVGRNFVLSVSSPLQKFFFYFSNLMDYLSTIMVNLLLGLSLDSLFLKTKIFLFVDYTDVVGRCSVRVEDYILILVL